ncbi:MAG: asparaginase [Planctomycetota bacterium]|nr:asparaginase [Planctomycetota bacterium]
MSAIRLFATGGTFDKEYHEISGELYFRETHVPAMLALGRCRLDIRVETLMLKDSLHLTAEDRRLICQRCAAAEERRIVITHGTDTMVETAAAIAAARLAKTIVLTGAMVPYTFGSSDGLFNLGSAIAFVQTLAPGVYLAMNGRYFPWNNVRKDRERGVFEPLRS